MSMVGASSYSFQRLLRTGQATLYETPRLARNCGADVIEFACGGNLTAPLDRMMAETLRQVCAEAGVQVAAVSVAAELLRGSPEDREKSRTLIMQQLESASLLGATRFRHDATLGPEDGNLSDAAFEAALPVLVEHSRLVADRAGELGIQSSIENHGLFMQHADRVARLVEAVDRPNFGVTLDLGNSLFATQDHVAAARTLAPHAINVHVKDFIINPTDAERAWETYPAGPVLEACTVGDGDVNVQGCLQHVVEAGYDGPFIVEFEGAVDDPPAAVRRGIERVREMIAALVV